MATATQQKTLGAFYTDLPIAQHLVRWAVRESTDSVLDPSCGAGVFLTVAAERLRTLGSVRPKLWGVDLAPDAVRSTSALLPSAKILDSDFFSISPEDVPAFSVIVGNPPFVRYQTFGGPARDRALQCARSAGVQLPKLASSWAPFLVHATRFLQHGGRLAMVVPAELGHAQYAKGVLSFLLQRFARVTVMMFREKLFPQLNEETFLLQCEGYGTPCSWLSVARCKDIGDADQSSNNGNPAEIRAITSGRSRLAHYRISLKARKLYEYLSESDGATRLENEADIGIGYVTGCNDYFHLSESERKHWKIPSKYLRRAFLSLAGWEGAVLENEDWFRLRDSGAKAFLLSLPTSASWKAEQPLSSYLGHGVRLTIPGRFKCRVRNPWYAVPHVRSGDALLSYMCGHVPRLVENRARLFSPNTLHVVRFNKKSRLKMVLAGWYSSLTKLSCEMEGHALGGGMLKLEPTEAGRVVVALPQPGWASRLVKQIDQRLRARDSDGATQLVDQSILRGGLALSAAECQVLQDAADELRNWRLGR